MNNLISIIPLSYNSSRKDIKRFFTQISKFSVSLEVIIVLENNDKEGYKNWKSISRKYSKFKITIEKLTTEKTKGRCLNRAITLCNSKYFMRCDMDDEIYPYRYSETIKTIINNSGDEIDMIYSDLIDLKNKKVIRYATPRFLSIVSIWRNPIPAPTVCIRKDFLKKNNIYYPPYNRCEDLFLVLKFIDNNANIIKTSKPLVGYSNNILLKRDYKNWILNALIRFKRKRFDFIGFFSFIFGIIIFIYGILRLILSNAKNIYIKNLLTK